ncbi:MAG TPA: 50S ribosomal protein L9 [Eubacterium sp.]|nr:50S ribosomal protein L9 [Eubacterium sp.]HBZ53271.1 50S ribosomal protein L9 [Eubacterium sp.]
MEVILLEDVKSLGKKDEIVTVNDGYARNFILPKKLGVEATAKSLAELKAKKRKEAELEQARVDEAKRLAALLGEKSVTVKLRSGENGKVYGAVSSKEISAAVKEQLGLDLDKKKIVLKEGIKSLGVTEVPVKLYKEVSTVLRVKVAEE